MSSITALELRRSHRLTELRKSNERYQEFLTRAIRKLLERVPREEQFSFLVSRTKMSKVDYQEYLTWEDRELEEWVPAFDGDESNREWKHAQSIVAVRKASEEARVLRPVKATEVPVGEVVLNERRLAKEAWVSMPKDVAIELKPHQMEGVRFLWHSLWDDGRVGCVLADHMGMGKTATTVAFASLLLRQKQVPVLILAPLSVVGNWGKEIERWTVCKDARVFLVTAGSQPSHHQDIQDWALGGGFLVTNYEYFVKLTGTDNSDRGALLDPFLAILDEGHKIRNMDSGITQRLRSIKTGRRLVLSGYPLQNNLMEYWSMMDWACPNFLGDKSFFRRLFEKPISDGYRRKSSPYAKGYARRRAWILYDELRPLVIRRPIEHLTAQLPGKADLVLFCSLSPTQKRLLTCVADVWSSPTELRLNFLLVVHLLRNLFVHPSALRLYLKGAILKGTSTPSNLKRIQEAVGVDGDGVIFADDEGCKLALARRICKDCLEKGEKILVFTQSLSVLDILHERLGSSFGLDCIARFDGQSTMTTRDETVANFNNPESSVKILLLSTGAGGEGLNLTGASRVIIMDLEWNPCHTAQATGRAYRFGQIRKVHIYRLVVDSSFETDILYLGCRKNSVSETVVDNKPIPILSHELDLPSFLSYNTQEDQSIENDDLPGFLADDPALTQVFYKERKHFSRIQAFPFSFDEPNFAGVDEKMAQRELEEAAAQWTAEQGIEENDPEDPSGALLDDAETDLTVRDYMRVYGGAPAALTDSDHPRGTTNSVADVLSPRREKDDKADKSFAPASSEGSGIEVVVISSDDDEDRQPHRYEELRDELAKKKARLKRLLRDATVDRDTNERGQTTSNRSGEVPIPLLQSAERQAEMAWRLLSSRASTWSHELDNREPASHGRPSSLSRQGLMRDEGDELAKRPRVDRSRLDASSNIPPISARDSNHVRRSPASGAWNPERTHTPDDVDKFPGDQADTFGSSSRDREPDDSSSFAVRGVRTLRGVDARSIDTAGQEIPASSRRTVPIQARKSAPVTQEKSKKDQKMNSGSHPAPPNKPSGKKHSNQKPNHHARQRRQQRPHSRGRHPDDHTDRRPFEPSEPNRRHGALNMTSQGSSGQSQGVGRGRDRTLPAWAINTNLSKDSNPTGPPRNDIPLAPPRQLSGPTDSLNEPPRGLPDDPGELFHLPQVGAGRGRSFTLPAWKIRDMTPN